jgi:hypothetical protein
MERSITSRSVAWVRKTKSEQELEIRTYQP